MITSSRTGTTDRCEEHAAALEEMLEADGAPEPRKRRGNPKPVKITTIEEIEASKRQRLEPTPTMSRTR